MEKLIYRLTMHRNKNFFIQKYSEEWYEIFCKKSEQKFRDILPKMPHIGESIFSFNYKFAPSYIAWYSTFLEMNVPKQEIDSNIWSMHENLVSIIPKNILKKYGKAYFNSFRKKAAAHVRKQDSVGLNPYDWQIEYQDLDDNSFEIIIKTCGFKKLAKEYNVEGLLPGICRMDYLFANMMDNGFERTKTLGDNDDCCNGIYRMTGSCEWAPEKGFEDRK
mgnify:CR=1 FL=1|jgi:hypothetical protein